MIEDELTAQEVNLVIQHGEGLAYYLDEAIGAYIANTELPDFIYNAMTHLLGSTIEECIRSALLDAVREEQRKQQLQADEETAALKFIEDCAKKLYPHETDPLWKAAEVIFERNNSQR